MTQGQTVRASGFRALLLSDGEPLDLEGSVVTLTSLINRTLKSSDLKRFEREGGLDFEPQGLSMLEFMTDAVENRPVAGNGFIDGDNVRHRVRYVQRTEFSWICLCTVSDVV